MKHIKHICWDLDGVFFRHDDQYQQALHRSLARHIADHYDMNFDDALALAHQSQIETRKCFTPFLERYRLGFEELAKPVYQALDIGFMQIDPALRSIFDAIKTDHAIITTSDMPWAKRVIAQLQLEQFFSEANITACADFNNFRKADSPAPYLHTLDKLGFAAEHTMMIEDTQRNLKHAKALGITTVLVNSSEDKADYTDYVFETLEGFLECFLLRESQP